MMKKGGVETVRWWALMFIYGKAKDDEVVL